MNRDQIIGLVLIFLIIFGTSWWLQPSQEEREALKRKQDSVQMARELQHRKELQAQMRRDSVQRVNEQNNALQQNTPAQDSANLISKWGEFAAAAQGENKTFEIENDLVKLRFSSKGGRVSGVQLKDYQTYDSLPLVLFNEETSKFALSFFYDNRVINTADLYFQPYLNGQALSPSNPVSVSGDQTVTFAMRLPVEDFSGQANDRYIEFQYIISGDSYLLDYNVKFHNLEQKIAFSNNTLNIDWSNDIQSMEKSVDDERKVTTVYYKHFKDDVESLNETSELDEEEVRTSVKWVGFKQKFFASVLMADNYFEGAKMMTEVEQNKLDEAKYIKTTDASIEVPFDGKTHSTIGMKFYFGPLKYKILNSFDYGFEQMIPLGWWLFRIINKYAVIFVFNLLETTGLNYGIIILILTFLLKLVLFPVAYKTYVSSAKMRVLKPEVDEINAKYPKQEDAMKKQQATMNLYKRAGVNPLAGCVPMLLQMPILIAMFRFFPSSIELRQQSFLWAEDLSTYDSVYDLGFNIPFYGDHVSLFTLLMTISTIIYTKVNSELMGTNNNQMPGMKTMMYLMPLMFLGFLNNYASGLSYYYLLANLMTFAQMYLIRKTVDDDKLRLQIQKNKKKPMKKKSGFMQRLEEAQKMQQKQMQGRKK